MNKLFNSLNSKSSSVSIHIDQPIIFVQPPTIDSTLSYLNLEEEEPMNDPLLYGSLNLDLLQTKKIKSLKVTLEGTCELTGGEGHSYQKSHSLQKEVILNLDTILEAGTHSFNFSFIIPSDTAHYHKSEFGRIRHLVKGFVEFDNEQSITSAPKQIWIVQTESLNTYHGVSHYIQRTSDFLGQIALTITSPHLSSNSSLKVMIELDSPPPIDVTILSVDTYITQAFASMYEGSISYKPFPERYSLRKEWEGCSGFESSVDSDSSCSSSEELESCAASTTGSSRSRSSSRSSSSTFSTSSRFNKIFNSSRSSSPSRSSRSSHSKKPTSLAYLSSDSTLPWNYTSLLQIPNSEIIKPSTLSNTNSRLKVNHKISVCIRYRLEGGEEKLLTLSKKINVASCKCLTSSLILPTYSEKVSTTSVTSTAIPDYQKNLGEGPCQCSVSTTTSNWKQELEKEYQVLELEVGESDSSWNADVKRERNHLLTEDMSWWALGISSWA